MKRHAMALLNAAAVFLALLLLQTVPIVVITPLILMWVGPVTLVAFIICLAPIIANCTQGLISVKPLLQVAAPVPSVYFPC